MEAFKPKPDLYGNLRKQRLKGLYTFSMEHSLDGGSTGKTGEEKLLTFLGRPVTPIPLSGLTRVDYQILPAMTEQSMAHTIQRYFRMSDRLHHLGEQILKRLTSEEQRAVDMIMLSEEAPSLADIAKELGCSPDDAQMHIRRGYFKLRHPNRELPENLK